MASAARSIALGLALGGISSNTGAYAAGPRLRTPSFVKTADERASKACGLRITLASQPAGIGRDCGGAGCEALPRASRFKDATVGIFGGPTHDIFDASSWREIFDVDCVDGGRILHVTFDPVEGHSLVCELGPVENISSVQDKVCSGPDGAHFYYTVEHVETFPPKDTGVDRVNPQLAPRLLQTGNDSTASPTTTDTTSSTDDTSDETDAPAAQPTSSSTPESDSTPSPETPTPAPVATLEPSTVVATLEPSTVEPTAEPTTVEPTAEPTTVEPTAEPTTVEPTAEPTTVEPTAEPTTIEPTAEPTTVEPTAEPTTVEPTAEPTTVEPTAEPTTVEPTAEPTPKQTSVPETEASTPEPSATLSSTPGPTAEPASEPTPSPIGMTPAPLQVESTPTPTLLPSPEPSTPEPSGTIVPTSQLTVPTPQPATLEATPTSSGTISGGEPTPSPVVGETPQPTAMPVVPPTPKPTATVAPVSSPTATPVKPVTAPPTSLPPSLEPTTSPAGASTRVMTNSPVESVTQPPVSSPTVSPKRAVPTPPPVAAPPTSAPVDLMTTEPTGRTESIAPVGATPAMVITAGPIVPTAPPVAAPPTSAPVDSMTIEPTGRTESIAPVGATPSMELTEGPTPASVPAPVGTATLMPVAARTVAPSSESFVEEEYSYSSPVTLVPLTASPSTASPQKEVVSTPVPLPTPPPPPPSPSPAASSPAPTGNGSAAAFAASTGDALEGTTSAPASTPTVTPSTGTPLSSSQAGPTVQPTSLSTTAGPVAVTPSPTDLGLTPTPVFTTPAPSSLEECRDECSDIDTGSTWTGNYYDSSCSTNTTQGGCGLNGDDENCRRCVINRANFAESSSSAGADEWPDCLCCVAADAGVESDLDDCENVTPSPTSSLETIILSEDELDLMMLTGAFDGDNCEANGIALIDDTVISITKFADSNGDCTDSFDMLYGTTECISDTNYNWTYSSNEYTYSYECPDPDTTSNERFRRRRLSESEETVTISSENVLCNDGDVFYSVSRAEEDESVAIVYANTKADGFEDATGNVESAASGGDYCDDVSAATTAALVAGVDTLIDDAGGGTGSGTDTTIIAIIVSVVALVVLLLLCACYCCYRSRKGKEGRADQMRRNLGFTPDMDRKGEGNFGPTNKHVAITRGGGAQMTSEMLATKTYQPGTGQHHRAPSEAPSSIIEDNIANNYRPKKAAQNWEKRKEHKSTKPAPQQHVIGAGPTSEELKVEDNMPATSVRSEQLSEHSLTQHDISSARQSGSHPSVAQTQYSYAFNDVEMDPAEEEEEEDDDDARSAATGMSGPSKYAPSGYAPSSHQEGVTHDLMSQYEPSVYEADSQYDPSLYGRESEFGEESSAYSYGPSSRNGSYGQGGNYAGRGRQAVPHGPSARASVADTAAMSHLGSVMEMDDGGETNSAYAPSDSYVSSYLSSEDDEIGRGRPTRGHHHLADSRTPPGGYGSRHNVYRSGREAVNAGRGGFGGGGGSSIEASSRHSGGRSGFEVDSRDYDEEDSDMHHMSAAMDDMEYQDSRITTSSQGAPLTGVDDRNGRRW